MGREYIDDTVDGLSRRVGMQGGKGQVARFRDTKGRLDSFQVPHLTNEHYVGIFTKYSSERIGEAVGVGVKLSLIDQAGLVIV
jgi:hypothetical protein